MFDEDEKIYVPSECYFHAGPDTIYEEENVVLVEIWLKDDSNSQWLGSHNLTGLPEYFGSESMEGCWYLYNSSVETTIRHMEMCGFEYKEQEF